MSLEVEGAQFRYRLKSGWVLLKFLVAGTHRNCIAIKDHCHGYLYLHFTPQWNE